MVAKTRVEDVGRLIFEAHALVDGVRALGGQPGQDVGAWGTRLHERSEALWDDLVAAMYAADGRQFGETVSALIGLVAPHGQAVLHPGLDGQRRARLVEDLMRQFTHTIAPFTDVNGVLLPAAEAELDEALVALRTRQRHALGDGGS